MLLMLLELLNSLELFVQLLDTNTALLANI
jgi:hypothetical protein